MAPSSQEAGLTSGRVDKHSIRTLLIFLGAGSGIFASGFLLVIYAVTVYGQLKLDSSAAGLYQWVAGAGALFGFERWWAYESGGVNPFRDR